MINHCNSLTIIGLGHVLVFRDCGGCRVSNAGGKITNIFEITSLICPFALLFSKIALGWLEKNKRVPNKDDNEIS